MAAYNCTALRAFPSFLFLFKELIDAVLLDEFEVLYHAHPEISSVALVDMAEPFARVITAFITIFNFAAQEQGASLF